MADIGDKIQVQPFVERRADERRKDVLSAGSRWGYLDALIGINQNYILQRIVTVFSDAKWVRDNVGRWEYPHHVPATEFSLDPQGGRGQ